MWGALKKLNSSQSGATLVYISVTLAALIGFIGLAIDFSRHHVTSQQVQAASDAAALAAATQLDRKSDAIDRALAAAKDAPIVGNTQRFGGNAVNSEVMISEVNFIHGDDLPPSDDTPIDPADFLPIETAEERAASSLEAEYAIVQTSAVNHENFFIPFVGASRNSDITADSVATQTSAICRTTPFFICNPDETTTHKNFDIDNWKKKQIKVIASASTPDAWGPGNFGFLNIPDSEISENGNEGAKSLAEKIASVDGVDQCFSTQVETKTGAMASLRSAINVRFDIFENPFFQDGNGATAPNKLDQYAPAPNVTKGRVFTACATETLPVPSAAMGLPRDQNIVDSVDGSVRLGNGSWNCPAYWAANHGGTAPTGCDATYSASSLSRWDIYLMETDPTHPDYVGLPQGITTDGSPSPESGAPVCHDAASDPSSLNLRRRNVTFAIVNCIENEIKGSSTDVNTIAFVEAFLTEPVPDSGGGVEFDIYMEVIDIIEIGQANGVLKEYVEIVR